MPETRRLKNILIKNLDWSKNGINFFRGNTELTTKIINDTELIHQI